MLTTLIIIGTIILLVLFMVIYSRHKMKNLPVAETHESIAILTDKNFNHQLKDKLVLVDFWAEWCMPCKIMLPILNDVAANSDGSYLVAKVDVDSNQGLAQKYGIRSIPTLVAFKDGKEVARFVGVKQKNFLINEMKKLS